jgi:hypothetical protein
MYYYFNKRNLTLKTKAKRHKDSQISQIMQDKRQKLATIG